MSQRERLVIPLDVVADHGRRVLYAVGPLHAGPTLGRVQVVARQNVDRRAVAVRVVNRHRRVLNPHRAVAQHRHGLALGLEIGVRHGDR